MDALTPLQKAQGKCPTCNGTGQVPRDFYIVSTWPVSNEPPQTCKTCDGTGEYNVEVKK